MKFSIIAFLLVGYAFGQTDIYQKRGYAIGGYDIVSYFDGVVKEGDKALSSEFNKVTFLFSSKENLEKFTAEPERYLPEYGGFCAYGVALNKKVKVDPKTYEIRDGKLYLFYNSWGMNTLTRWQKANPDSLKLVADKNWEKIKGKG
ncbi:YHS domain-containing (seleno)protein [Sungkyunkwania multivorans]|uniref:YHS domain-containing (Seleno)protein n=1 Tax=Sungkyunkwania multivorans TaxID=1173618 RepID=A0ABW3CVG6_9FLAO